MFYIEEKGSYIPLNAGQPVEDRRGLPDIPTVYRAYIYRNNLLADFLDQVTMKCNGVFHFTYSHAFDKQSPNRPRVRNPTGVTTLKPGHASI